MQDAQTEIHIDGRRYLLAEVTDDTTNPEHPAVYFETTQAWFCLTCASTLYGTRRMAGFLKKANTEATSRSLGRTMRFNQPVGQRCSACTRKI